MAVEARPVQRYAPSLRDALYAAAVTRRTVVTQPRWGDTRSDDLDPRNPSHLAANRAVAAPATPQHRAGREAGRVLDRAGEDALAGAPPAAALAWPRPRRGKQRRDARARPRAP